MAGSHGDSVELLAQFLVSRGYISPGQLMRVLQEQERSSRPVGDYAVGFGYLSREDADRIHQHQLSNSMRFGEASIALGLLTEEQVHSALTAQRNEQVSLGDALVKLGALSESEFQKATLEFMQDQVRFAELAMSVPPEAPHRAALMRIFELTRTLLLRVWGMRSTPEGISLGPDPFGLLQYSATVELSGDLEGLLLVSAPEGCVIRGAQAVLKVSDLSEEERLDLLREFVNVVAGHAVGALAINGIRVNISTPDSPRGSVPLDGRLAVVSPCLTGEGLVQTAFFVRPLND